MHVRIATSTVAVGRPRENILHRSEIREYTMLKPTDYLYMLVKRGQCAKGIPVRMVTICTQAVQSWRFLFTNRFDKIISGVIQEMKRSTALPSHQKDRRWGTYKDNTNATYETTDAQKRAVTEKPPWNVSADVFLPSKDKVSFFQNVFLSLIINQHN